MYKLYRKFIVRFTLISLGIFLAVLTIKYYSDQYFGNQSMLMISRGLHLSLTKVLPKDPKKASQVLAAYASNTSPAVTLQPISETQLHNTKDELIHNGYSIDMTHAESSGLVTNNYLWPEDYVLTIPMSYRDTPNAIDYIHPTFTLITQLVENSKSQDITKILTDSFHFNFQVETVTDLHLTSAEERRLQQQKWLHKYHNHLFYDRELLYILQKDGSVLQVGPISWPINDETHDFIMFTLLLALIMLLAYFIATKLYQQLSCLEVVAKQCSEGEFPSSASLPNRSLFNSIETTLLRMSQSLKKMLTSQQVLTQSLSHDIRTPLMRLKFRLDGVGLSAEDRQLIEQDINDIEDLVESIKLYITHDGKKPELNIGATELSSLLKEHISSYLSNPSINCTLVCDDELYWHLDQFLFSRVIFNLLDNANNYAHSYVHVTVSTNNNMLLISIANDIATSTSSGWRMGLTVAERMMDWHGGELHTSSHDGIFEVQLRLKDDTETPRK